MILKLFFNSSTIQTHVRLPAGISIPVTVELTNNNPTLAKHRSFWDFNLNYMSFTDYQLVWLLNITNLTLAQPEKPFHRLQNYCVVNFDSLQEQYSKFIRIIFFLHSLGSYCLLQCWVVLGPLLVLVCIPNARTEELGLSPKVSLLHGIWIIWRIIKKLELCFPVTCNN